MATHMQLRMSARLLLAGLALTTLPACFQLGVQAQAGYASLAVDGDLGYVNGQSNASIQQDVRSAFGLGDNQGSPYLRAKVDFGVPNLSVSAFTFQDEGEGTLQADFGDVPANLPVRSELDLLNVKTALAFEIPLGPLPVSISPGIAVDYFDLQVDVRDQIGVATEQLDLNAPVPLAFLRGEADVSILSAVVELGYMAIDIEDVSASMLDVEAQLQVHPAPLLDLFVGYRHLQLAFDGEIDGDTVDTDITIAGFMIGGGVRF